MNKADIDEAVRTAKSDIEDAIDFLTDEEYVAALYEISGVCVDLAVAKVSGLKKAGGRG